MRNFFNIFVFISRSQGQASRHTAIDSSSLVGTLWCAPKRVREHCLLYSETSRCKSLNTNTITMQLIGTGALSQHQFSTSPSISINFQGSHAGDDCGSTSIRSTMLAFSVDGIVDEKQQEGMTLSHLEIIIIICSNSIQQIFHAPLLKVCIMNGRPAPLVDCLSDGFHRPEHL